MKSMPRSLELALVLATRRTRTAFPRYRYDGQIAWIENDILGLQPLIDGGVATTIYEALTRTTYSEELIAGS